MRTRLLLLCGLAVVLAGCESTTAPSPATRPVEPGPSVARDLPRNIQQLVSMATNATGNEADRYYIEAAEQALAAERPDQAERILALVLPDEATTTRLQTRYRLVRAEIAITRGEGFNALEQLRTAQRSADESDPALQVRIGILRARAYLLTRSYVASASERIFVHPQLPDDSKQENSEAIFTALTELPADMLAARAEEAITSDLRGWLSLAALTKSLEGNPSRQLVELNRWKKVWSHHPAAANMPASLQVLARILEEQPTSLALLLPVNGELSAYGRAIRDGFLAAHYRLAQSIPIRIYDSSQGDVLKLIDQAASDGAELVIGPLDRELVTTVLNARKLPVPVLALNRALTPGSNANVYQFALAPEDEVSQVARQVYTEGKRNALVLYASDDWGARNFANFEAQWSALGGNITDATAFDRQQDYSDLVKGLLSVDESEARAAELRRITGQRFEFTPRRRQDIDFIFMLATQADARRLNPTLAFYYAEDLPVYATSHVYQVSESRIDAIDLNGIRFCDIPWKLSNTDSVQQEVTRVYPAARSALAPFYALGVDAYRLFPRLPQLREIPDARVFGTTGVLRLAPGNIVTRELMWAQFRDGEVSAIPMIMDAAAE